jgi:hypothetical protein
MMLAAFLVTLAALAAVIGWDVWLNTGPGPNWGPIHPLLLGLVTGLFLAAVLEAGALWG